MSFLKRFSKIKSTDLCQPHYFASSSQRVILLAHSFRIAHSCEEPATASGDAASKSRFQHRSRRSRRSQEDGRLSALPQGLPGQGRHHPR